MKKRYLILLISLIYSFSSFAEFGRGRGNDKGNNGNGQGNGGNQNVPIDSEIVYLLIGGALFGVWSLRKKNNIQEI